MYKIKRFSSTEKSGMSTGAKLALGAAAVGGGLLAGRTGLLGKGVKNFMKGGAAKKATGEVIDITPKLLT